MTLADKIREMTNEEIANIVEFVDCFNDYFVKDTNVRTKTRDLTDEEAAVYDQWLNYDAKKTGEKLW